MAFRQERASEHGDPTVTVAQVSAATMDAMAPGELDSARLRRDLSLLLRRRLTLYAGIGAAGFTVLLSVLAATTVPGRATPPANTPAAADPTANPQQQPVEQQPSFVLPAQAPQNGSGGGPVAISGGS
jgi:hypothetical protein